MTKFYIYSNAPIVSIVRGDSFEMPIFINDGDRLHFQQHELADDEYVYFSLMEPNTSFEQGILRKMYSKRTFKFDEHGTPLLQLEPWETENLAPGTYYYSVKLRKTDQAGTYEEVRTILNKTVFNIL